MPSDPETVLRALDKVGVDFSIPRARILEFLANAEFTPYPALAAGLLKLLEGKTLRRPVFLDVIVFNYEHSPGNPSPRDIADVDFAVLKTAVLAGFNTRYGQENTDFQAVIKPLTLPNPQLLVTVVDGMTSVQNGVILTNTDNPQVEVTTKLINVRAEFANGMVPQELTRLNNGWRFNNGDVHLSVSGGEADAQSNRPVRAGALNDSALAWPAAEGTFSGNAGAEVKLMSRIRVGYRPVDVKLLVNGPKGFAANATENFRIALDPNILLVPVEVARFFSDQIPVSNISAMGQMALWDQVPIVSPTTNFKSIDGGTGELKLAERAWDFWPKADAEGLHNHGGWISPDSIWGKAGVRFRLVNYIDIKADNVHAAPVANEGTDDRRLRENNTALNDHPQHIKDKRVLKVIFMHRIAPPSAPEVGRALISNDCIGIAAGLSDKSAAIAHEIGHLMTGSQNHSTLPNNVMNDPGPGTDITEGQAVSARTWAQGFAGFWQH